MIIVTRRQDVTASVTFLGKRYLVLLLRNRSSVPLLMLNRLTDQEHVATYAIPTDAQFRFLCEEMIEYFPLRRFRSGDYVTGRAISRLDEVVGELRRVLESNRIMLINRQ